MYNTLASSSRVFPCLLLLLRREHLNCSQIAEEIYMSPVRVREYMRYLMRTKQVYVTRWDKKPASGKAYWYAVYAWGKGESKPKPVSTETSAERLKRRYHERKKDDPEWYYQMLAKRKASYIKRNPIVTGKQIGRAHV